MPFAEVYAVNFSNGNRHPHLNVHGWPDMVLSAATSADQAEHIPDADGLILRITRGTTVPSTTLSWNTVQVVPATGWPCDSRLLLRLMFDHPHAEELSPPPSPPALRQWAVGLRLSAENHLSTDNATGVTCQFHNGRNGVRLNTPSELQSDQSALLDSPLDYSRYQGASYQPLPDDDSGPQGGQGNPTNAPSLFVLEHSFSGYPASAMSGSGILRIYRKGKATLRDHRVYGTTALNSATSLRALGCNIVTLAGAGRMGMRLRAFSVSVNGP